jgi:hypothetical protein
MKLWSDHIPVYPFQVAFSCSRRLGRIFWIINSLRWASTAPSKALYLLSVAGGNWSMWFNPGRGVSRDERYEEGAITR